MNSEITSGDLLSSRKTVSLKGPILAFLSLRLAIIERTTCANGIGP